LNFLALIASLLPLISQVVPGSSEATLLATAAINIIKLIQSQSGMTTDQILQHAGATLDENERMLLEDLARLQGPTGGTQPSGSSGGTQPSGGSGGTQPGGSKK